MKKFDIILWNYIIGTKGGTPLDDIKLVIAKNISALRIGKKLTQLELADALNYSDKAVSKWERGESIPDVITLKRIADLFGVTVDYILTEHIEPAKPHANKVKHNNHIVISLIAFFAVWLIGTCTFVLLDVFEQNFWLAFIVCIPASISVLIVFNSIWGKKRMNLFLISALMWTSFLTIYISLLLYTPYNFWLIFIIGIPGQIIILLCFRIKGSNKKLRQAIADKYASLPKRIRKPKTTAKKAAEEPAETNDNNEGTV